MTANCADELLLTAVTNGSSGLLPPAKRPTSSLPVHKSTPPITILTNPARAKPAPAKKAPTTQRENASTTIPVNPTARAKPVPTAKKAQPGDASTTLTQKHATAPTLPDQYILIAAVAAADEEARKRFRLAAAERVKAAARSRSENKPRLDLPKIVIHGPCSWDSWTEVHFPETSHGEMLDVPDLNTRCRMFDDDVARYYPKDYAAELAMHRLRSMLRSGRRLAAARRRECARQAQQTTPTHRWTDTVERSHWSP
jgi:hypothetical protein